MATRARITSWFKNIVVAATIFVIEIDPWKSKVLHAPAQIGFSREKFQETIRIASSLKAIHPINKLNQFQQVGLQRSCPGVVNPIHRQQENHA